jgi:hypothetical protein
MSEIRHVFMDLDGSVIDGTGAASPGLIDMIRSTPTIDWGIVTGRSFVSTARIPLAQHLPRSGLHVFDGGATVASFDEGYISRRVLRKRELRLARRYIDLRNVAYLFASIALQRGLAWCSTERIELSSVENVESIRHFWRAVLHHRSQN